MKDGPPDPVAVAAAFQGTVSDLVPLGGAWSNRVFRLDIGGRAFVVKEMRNAWNIPHWREWLREAWEFEQAAIGAGVAAPRPVSAPDGDCLAEVQRTGGGWCAIRMHAWVEGVPAPLGPADDDLAAWVGATLATLHSLGVVPKDRSLFPRPNIDNAQRWPTLVEAARASGVGWADAAAGAADAVAELAALVVETGDGIDEEIMTHGDVDQKNILITEQGPVLCAWDVAAPLVPRREVEPPRVCWRLRG